MFVKSFVSPFCILLVTTGVSANEHTREIKKKKTTTKNNANFKKERYFIHIFFNFDTCQNMGQTI